jgi:hypothetical protein
VLGQQFNGNGGLETDVGRQWQDFLLMLLAGNKGLKEEYKSEDVAMHDVVWLVKQYVKGMCRLRAGRFWDVKRCNGNVKDERKKPQTPDCAGQTSQS